MKVKVIEFALRFVGEDGGGRDGIGWNDDFKILNIDGRWAFGFGTGLVHLHRTAGVLSLEGDGVSLLKFLEDVVGSFLRPPANLRRGSQFEAFGVYVVVGVLRRSCQGGSVEG